MAMIAITTKSSIRVNPDLENLCALFIAPSIFSAAELQCAFDTISYHYAVFIMVLFRLLIIIHYIYEKSNNFLKNIA